MKFYDITQTLGNDSACWPGDTAFRFDLTWKISEGASVNVSRIILSPHNGTHADAPFHCDDQGLRMADLPVDRYIGPALLISLEGRPSITERDLQAVNLAGSERVLIRTGSCPDRTRFHPDFTYIEPGAVRYLAACGVTLVGTDAHSVDPAESKDLPAHHACHETGILILENLSLAAVPPGRYELIALPLKLEGADGSPVRAVLRELP